MFVVEEWVSGTDTCYEFGDRIEISRKRYFIEDGVKHEIEGIEKKIIHTFFYENSFFYRGEGLGKDTVEFFRKLTEDLLGSPAEKPARNKILNWYKITSGTPYGELDIERVKFVRDDRDKDHIISKDSFSLNPIIYEPGNRGEAFECLLKHIYTDELKAKYKKKHPNYFMANMEYCI
jgi:hypothetical protein